jgi:phytoene desaturase
MKKALVVGAGIAGIASALRLKAKGYDVDVYEANSYLGGKLSAFELGPYRFDAGPSLFTMPHYVDELFLLFGENPKAYFQYDKMKHNCFYFYEDGTRLKCDSDREKFVKEISEKLGESPEILNRFIDNSALMYHYTEPVFLSNSLHRLSTYFSKSGLKGILNLWRLNVFSSMNAVNCATFKNPKTVQLFNRYATYNGSNPYLAPATLNIIPHLELEFGTFLPKKGMHQITESLVDLAKRKGVRFHVNKPVNQIVVENGRVKGVLINGQQVDADVVVTNMDVYPSYKKLMPHLKMPKRVRKIESSSSAMIFYWGIKNSFPELDLHNIFFSEDYELEFDSIFNKKTVHNDPTVYINITSKQVAEDAPEGCENWFVMVNVPSNHGQDFEDMRLKIRANVISKINRILKTNIESYIEEETYLDPVLIEKRTSSHRGALYGSSSNSLFSAFFRHPNYKSNVKGLYFCGGSVHPGGGIPLCLLSAKIVSKMID